MKLYYKNDRLCIISRYEDREILKSAGAIWSPAGRCWQLPFTLAAYTKAIAIPGMECSESIADYFSAKSEAIASGNFKTKQYAHQIALTELAIRMERSFFLAGVGVGKSKAAIDAITELHRQGRVARVLVVSPASVVKNFCREVAIHSDHESTAIVGTTSKRRELLQHDSLFHVINYDILAKMQNELVAMRYDAIICDEIHRVKSRTAQWSKALHAIVNGKVRTESACANADGMKYVRVKNIDSGHAIRYRIGLTGSLIANHWEDAFHPYKIISPEIFGENFKHFRDKYLIMGGFRGPYGPTQIVGYRNKEEFQRMLAINSLRYDLDDVVDLPPEVEIVREVAWENGHRETYEMIKRDFIITYENEQKVTANVLEQLLRLQQVSSGFMPAIQGGETIPGEYVDLSTEKLDALEGILGELGDSDKAIVWCRFTHSIDRVAALCERMGISHMIYDGRTKDKWIYEKFNTDDTRIWIGQLATGVGYSIPAARYAIFYELDFSRINHIQSKGRNRRLTGSEARSCIYYYLLMEDALDRKILDTLKEKDFNANIALELVTTNVSEKNS